MYQAQQEAELGELQNQENVKQLFQSVRLQLFCLLGDIEDSALKTKGRVKQRTVWYSQWKLIHKYRMGR